MNQRQFLLSNSGNTLCRATNLGKYSDCRRSRCGSVREAVLCPGRGVHIGETANKNVVHVDLHCVLVGTRGGAILHPQQPEVEDGRADGSLDACLRQATESIELSDLERGGAQVRRIWWNPGKVGIGVRGVRPCQCCGHCPLIPGPANVAYATP